MFMQWIVKNWNLIGSNETTSNIPPFIKLSHNAKSSRKKKTLKLNVTVFVNVVSDNAFEQQPYDEERTVLVRNKYKYLSFHEDNRPPYYGTWSKEISSVVTGKTPLAKDTTHLDYDFDSEAEWEEGDDEQGEDCSMNDNEDDEIDDEEGDIRKYNFQDGWLTHDDEDLGRQDGNDDEETMVMRRKKTEECYGTANNTRGTKFSPASVLAPLMGGLPQVDANNIYTASNAGLIEGLNRDDACAVLLTHDVISLEPTFDLCLEAYPPDLVTEKSKSESNGSGSRKKTTKMSNQDLTDEDLKIFAKFVHGCTLKSKDIVVESLRSTHKNLTSSRAQATRKLDLIATKRRPKKGGVMWEVKDDVLTSLGLQDLIIPKEEKVKEEIPVKAPNNVKEALSHKGKKKEKGKKKGKETKSSLQMSTPPSPVIVSPQRVATPEQKSSGNISGNKRKHQISVASVNLLATFLNRKNKT